MIENVENLTGGIDTTETLEGEVTYAMPSGGVTQETDPTVPQHVKDITEEDITSWNNKSEFSGSYNDLTDTPTIENQYTDEDKTKVDLIDNTGDGSKYLSNDGTYKEVASGGGGSGAIEWTPSKDYFAKGTDVRDELTTLLGSVEVNNPVLLTNKSDFAIKNIYLFDPLSGKKAYQAVFKAGSTFWLFKNISNNYSLIPVEVFYAQYNNNGNYLKAKSGIGVPLGNYDIYAPYEVANISDYNFPIHANNTKSYTPSADYHPANKKYVDDLIAQLKADNNLV